MTKQTPGRRAKGQEGSRGNSAEERPVLPNVTLVATTGVAVGATIHALNASMRQAQFAETLLLSDRAPPDGTDPAISWRQIERLDSRADYSRFMLHGLAPHVRTTHALCAQWDGFVLNGAAWDPQFLEFDYIGAVWPQFNDAHNVGNGGFSLRSRKLLDACRDLPLGGCEAEDVLICRVHRRLLEERGIRFAPESVARRFSFERTAPNGAEFGFHGSFNLVRFLPAADALELFRELESQVLARSERAELVRWALARGKVSLALAIIVRAVRCPRPRLRKWFRCDN